MSLAPAYSTQIGCAIHVAPQSRLQAYTNPEELKYAGSGHSRLDARMESPVFDSPSCETGKHVIIAGRSNSMLTRMASGPVLLSWVQT